MTVEVLLRLLCLYAHLIACCFAICHVLSADLKILKGELARSEMAFIARRMSVLLLLLWGTGLPMVLIDLGGDLALLSSKPKLIAKIVCVCILSLNAVALHRFAFPRLMSGQSLAAREWKLVLSTGAISTSSWLFAAFLGIAKPLAGVLGSGQFLGLYALTLVSALGTALLLAGPLRRQLSGAQLLTA